MITNRFIDFRTQLPVDDPMVDCTTGQMYNPDTVAYGRSMGWKIDVRSPTDEEFRALRIFKEEFARKETLLAIRNFQQNPAPNEFLIRPLVIPAYAVAAVAVIFFAWLAGLLRGDLYNA